MFTQQNNPRLEGVLEWIQEQGGTVNSFNDHVEMGVVKGYRYRFFKSEGWIGLRTPECPPGQSMSFETKEDFIRMVESLPAAVN
jgi:hypothetical protein